MIDQRSDPASRYGRAIQPVLAALGGDPSTITPMIAEDLLALLDLAEQQLDRAPAIRTLWDPILNDVDLEYIMPCDLARVPMIAPLPRWRGATKHEPLQPLRAVASQ